MIVLLLIMSRDELEPSALHSDYRVSPLPILTGCRSLRLPRQLILKRFCWGQGWCEPFEFGVWAEDARATPQVMTHTRTFKRNYNPFGAKLAPLIPRALAKWSLARVRATRY